MVNDLAFPFTKNLIQPWPKKTIFLTPAPQ